MPSRGAVHHLVFKVGAGWIAAEATARGICRLSLPMPSRDEAREWLGPNGDPALEEHPILSQAQRELGAYFDGAQVRFGVPVDLSAVTPFRREVLRALMRVPYGSTQTYGELAAAIGKPTAARAVGQALARNPGPVIVRCHRIVGADGSLTGFGGGLGWKRALLELEHDAPL